MRLILRPLEQRGAFWQLEGQTALAVTLLLLLQLLSLLEPPPVAVLSSSASSSVLPLSLAVAVALLVVRGAGGGRDVAVLGGRGHASLPLLVEDEHGGTALEAGVAALARPVAVAGLAEGDVAVGVVLTQGCRKSMNHSHFL